MFASKQGPRTRRHPARAGLFGLVFLCAVAAAGGMVMLLWNAVLVEATGVKPLGFWQALGLLLLCRLLFGRWGPRRKPLASAPAEPSLRLSPEQRERFRASWQACAKPSAKQSAEPSAELTPRSDGA